jgi:hypothetical protein
MTIAKERHRAILVGIQKLYFECLWSSGASAKGEERGLAIEGHWEND